MTQVTFAGNYYNGEDYVTPCPWCGKICGADWVDVGIPGALQQVGPFHCESCDASEIGPYDERRPLTPEEKSHGWYAPHSEPGSSANVIGGRIVGHAEARDMYRALYPFSATDAGRKMIREGNLGSDED